MVVVNDAPGRELQGWILFVVGILLIVAWSGNWLVRGVEPNAIVVGTSMILVGYGDKLRRTP